MTEPIPTTALDPEVRRAKPRVGAVALGLWGQAETRRLVKELAAYRIPVLLLKGPDLQQRLYGTPAAYVSGDVDVMVPRKRAARTREALAREGWRFGSENGVLWRLSAAATYERNGFRADVHWGLHAAHLPASSLRALEHALWAGAAVGPSGCLEPDPESLFVFLAVHAVGHRFERAEWVRNVELAASLELDWNEVWRIARAARVHGAVRAAMQGGRSGDQVPILDGIWGRLVWYTSRVARGHILPQIVRDRIRESIALHREGFGWRSRPSRVVRLRDLPLLVTAGVFDPQEVSAGLADLASELLSDIDDPLIVEVGTGCGAISLLSLQQMPGARVYATDVSARALACARPNARRLGVRRIRFLQGHLTDPLPDYLGGQVDLLFSNVPYISAMNGKDMGDWAVPADTVYGPDPDGLGWMRMLAGAAGSLLRDGGYWVFQLGDSQWDYFADYMSDRGFTVIHPKERRVGHAVIGAVRREGGP